MTVRLVALAAVGVYAMALVPVAAADPQLPSRTQDSAESTIADGYAAKQVVCTPDVAPAFESVTWNPPGFTTEGGSGMIHDANPSLGGPFTATWDGDSWNVEYQYC